MPSKLKTYMLDELRSRFEDVEHCVVVNFSGVSALEMTELRAAVRKENGNLMVVKNSIATRAFRELGWGDEFIELLEGPVALAFGEDPATVVRVISDWDKKTKKLTFRGGRMGGRTIEQQAVVTLATLPALPVMRAIALGAVAAPLTSFMGVCTEVVRSFVRVVDQLSKQEDNPEESPAGSPAE